MFKYAAGAMVWLIVGAVFFAAGQGIYRSMTGEHAADANHIPRASGQGAFGALSEAVRFIERENVDWRDVDVDALWMHLQNMNALMLHTDVEKQKLANGLVMEVTGGDNAAAAMDEMIPAHCTFLATKRPDWDISFQKIETGYVIRVTSDLMNEVEKIQALGFAGFMVQDDHHAQHHLRIASGKQVHSHAH